MIADVIEGGIRLNLRFLIRFIQMVVRRSIRLIFISYNGPDASGFCVAPRVWLGTESLATESFLETSPFPENTSSLNTGHEGSGYYTELT